MRRRDERFSAATNAFPARRTLFRRDERFSDATNAFPARRTLFHRDERFVAMKIATANRAGRLAFRE
jgi:hypothetical protein